MEPTATVGERIRVGYRERERERERGGGCMRERGGRSRGESNTDTYGEIE